MNQSASKSALNRLIIVLVIVIGFMIYAYGWKATNISLKETQDPTRQNSVQRALRELLSPDIFSQDSSLEYGVANFEKECVSDVVEQPLREEGKPYVVLSPACGVRGDEVTVEGFAFPGGSTGRLFLLRPSGQPQPLPIVGTDGSNAFDIDGNGYFKTKVIIPNIRGEAGAIQPIQVESLVPLGAPYFSGTARVVAEKMVETIFLALMATTLALPISVVLSFLAARNLMKQVRLPLGTVLIAFLLLPVGWILGSILLAPVGEFGVRLGRDLPDFFSRLVTGAALIGAPLFYKDKGLKLDRVFFTRVRSSAISLVMLVVIIFALGLLGGSMRWLGAQLTQDWLGYIGNFLGTIGELIEISIAFIGSLIGALTLSSIGTSLTDNLIKQIPDIVGRALGGILGVASGALLMAMVAVVGSQVALFTVLPPFIAAILGGGVCVAIYNFWVGGSRQKRVDDEGIRRFISFASTAIIFILAAHVLNVMQFVVTGRLPGESFVRVSAIIGGVLGIGGFFGGLQAVFPIGDVVYNTTRTILNALRSIEPLIMGIVFVIWVGIGPFAGVLALTLHSIASLGKLYSEQIENIDAGPIEAIQSTGATRLQTIIYAVVPQIVPPYVAFTMYRWDINVRMSTIIGFVGGGGIGFLLNQQINLLRYREAGVAVLAIAIVVSILDYASATIRERMI